MRLHISLTLFSCNTQALGVQFILQILTYLFPLLLLLDHSNLNTFKFKFSNMFLNYILKLIHNLVLLNSENLVIMILIILNMLELTL